jgi:hypothetical protein
MLLILLLPGVKSWLKWAFLVVKSCFWGDEKSRVGDQIEALNGAKYRFRAQNCRKTKRRQTKFGAKCMLLGCFFV